MFVSRRSNDVLLGLYWWMLIIIIIIILTSVFINFVFRTSGKIRHDPLIIIIIIIILSSSSSSSNSKGKVILLQARCGPQCG